MGQHQFNQQLMLNQLFLHNQLFGQFKVWQRHCRTIPRWRIFQVPVVEPLRVKPLVQRSPVKGKAEEVCHQDNWMQRQPSGKQQERR